MYRELDVQRVTQPPANLNEFVMEIAAGIEAVYGADAAAAYAARAARGIGAALASPMASLWVAEENGCARALLLAAQRDETAEITLVHVLRGHTGASLEHALIAAAVARLRACGAQAITSEIVPHAAMDLDGAFAAAGLCPTRRGLFRVETARLAATASGDAGQPMLPAHFADAAQCIAAAYAGHPGRHLHPEVADAMSAETYLLRVMTGAYGPVLPPYCRVRLRGDACAGVLLGCEIAPKTGFVLQLAVAPASQRQGIARGLLGGFAQACERALVPHVMLGVTLDNPARALYESLGFTLHRPVTAYTWRAEGSLQAG